MNKNAVQKKPVECDEEALRVRRGKRRRRIWLAVLALVLAITITLSLLPDAASKTGGSISAVEALSSSRAETGNIESVFCGSGTLTDENANDITIVDSVQVLSYTVKNGDHVNKGDVLAKVDQNSALKAASELQDAIDVLDAQIESASSDSIASTLTAAAAGRVKAVYAEAGQSVADVMYEHGALMLISLDGLMAVDLENDGLMSVGDSLTVTLEDGTEVSGKVAQTGKSLVTVTLSDEKAACGENVTVSDSTGKTVGSGELYVHSALKVTGYSGTVSGVYASEGKKVSEGQSLIALSDTDYSGNYQSLIKQREEYSKQLEKLAAAYSQGYIYSEYDGIVSGISSGAAYSELSSVAEQGQITLLASLSQTCEGGVVPLAETDAIEPQLDAAPSEPSPSPEVNTTGRFAGKVTAVAYGQLSVTIDPMATSADILSLTSADESAFTQSVQLSPDSGTAVYMYDDAGAQAASLSDIKTGDYVILTMDSGSLTQIDCRHNQSTNIPGGGGSGASGGSFGGMGGTGTQAGTATAYTLSTTVVCSIVPSGSMTITVSVDEHDILSLALDQEAEVTLDAISGQSFRGEVTAIDPVGSNEGGGTKYSVTLTVDRTELMMDGMNASARITVAVTENALLVPELAIFEENNRLYVYTGYDKKSDTPTNPVEITTGVSDGTNVQILSGIEPGTTVYYKYADSLTYSW